MTVVASVRTNGPSRPMPLTIDPSWHRPPSDPVLTLSNGARHPGYHSDGLTTSIPFVVAGTSFEACAWLTRAGT